MIDRSKAAVAHLNFNYSQCQVQNPLELVVTWALEEEQEKEEEEEEAEEQGSEGRKRRGSVDLMTRTAVMSRPRKRRRSHGWRRAAGGWVCGCGRGLG